MKNIHLYSICVAGATVFKGHVIPAEAGIHVILCTKSRSASKRIRWIPAFAGMTPRRFSIKNYDAVYRNP